MRVCVLTSKGEIVFVCYVCTPMWCMYTMCVSVSHYCPHNRLIFIFFVKKKRKTGALSRESESDFV